MRGICHSTRSRNGFHEPSIQGTPYSEMTWYVCDLCGAKEERGQGLFYGTPRREPPTLGQRVQALEAAMKEEA